MRRLLIRPGAIGDVILSLPTLEAARADYTEVWAPRPMLPLIRFADRVRAIADTGLDLVGVVDHANTRALEGFDSIYSWYGFHRPEFREAVRLLPFTFFPALPPAPDGIPRIVLDGARLDGSTGAPPPDPNAFAVIHPFASSERKRWPLEHFRRVASGLAGGLAAGSPTGLSAGCLPAERSLAGRLPLRVRWCAGPEEPLEDAVRFEDLYELACWLQSARLYIGNDSGIGHLAAAVGVPVVAIFLDSDPLIWAPRGERVRALVHPAVEEVLSAAAGLLR